jgi:hypothetical protein
VVIAVPLAPIVALAEILVVDAEAVINCCNWNAGAAALGPLSEDNARRAPAGTATVAEAVTG